MIRLTAHVAVVAFLLLVGPLVAAAQQAGKTPLIGFLSESRQPWDEGFRQGLNALGYVAGQNITIEYRYAEGRFERLPGLAADLVRLNVDVIVAGGTHAIRAANTKRVSSLLSWP